MKQFLDESGLRKVMAAIEAKLAKKPDLVNGKIDSSLLPSYVDDVKEFAGTVINPTVVAGGTANAVGVYYATGMTADFKPGFVTKGKDGKYYGSIPDGYGTLNSSSNTSTPYTDKIYVDTSENQAYRWSGTELVAIGSSLALGETSSTAYAGDKGAALAKKVAALEANGTIPDKTLADLDTMTAELAAKYADGSLPARYRVKDAGGNVVGYVNYFSDNAKHGITQVLITRQDFGDLASGHDYGVVNARYRTWGIASSPSGVSVPTVQGKWNDWTPLVDPIVLNLVNTNTADIAALKKSVAAYPQVGNKQLPAPAITGTWSFFMADGTTAAQLSGVDARNPVVETGYQAQFSGTYMWTHADGKKDPTAVGTGSAWSDLPKTGVASKTLTTEKLTANTTLAAVIAAPKTGLMVSGQDVVVASGNDTARDAVSITFKSRVYRGLTTTASQTADTVKALASELTTDKACTASGITTTNTQYYVYAYPKSMGDLTTIIQDGALPVLGAFAKTVVSITNAAGKAMDYNVYRSTNPGAFANAQLNFK